MEAQGAGGAADAEAEKQARNRELLRAKLKEKQERLRNVDLQALVILSNASCLRTPCLDVGPWGGLALREDAWCSMGCSLRAYCLPLIASMQALDSLEDKARALQGKETAAKRKEIEDAVLSAFGH